MKYHILLTTFLLCIFLGACAPTDQLDVSTLSSEPGVDDAFLATLYFPPYLPKDMRQSIQLPEGVLMTDEIEKADIRLDVSGDAPASRWTYVLVAPFATVEDEVTLQDLQRFWRGEEGVTFPAGRLIMEGGTQAVFTKLWGNPSTANIASVSADLLQSTAWKEKTIWALVPFENLDPQWKVISVDGISPIEKEFDPDSYGLNVTFSFLGKAEILTKFNDLYGLGSERALIPASNRDDEKLTIVALTGVTALVRGTASLMERFGMTYPAMDIGGVLRNADITHISNEIPFVPTCPNPFSNPNNDQNLIFCSKPEYIQLLEAVGADVIELTGDHFRDWGAEAMNYTLDMYEARGWQYYGGGRNLTDGQEPALIVHNGNRIAFLGCNAKPSGYATASETSPGAVHCDLDVMTEKVKEVIEQGYLPIFTFQHIEYYRYTAESHLIEDFHRMADAGAIIVSGSQAHQPHALEFYRGALLHYGLGNLFFDQYLEGFARRQAFIDMHVFYDGKFISTKLVTILFIDLARPRLMTSAERQTLLKDIFFASNWQ